MPLNRVKTSVTAATDSIRRHWSRDEAQRRHLMAEVMQAQLLTALRFQPAPVVKNGMPKDRLSHQRMARAQALCLALPISVEL